MSGAKPFEICNYNGTAGESVFKSRRKYLLFQNAYIGLLVVL
jgi:hypothetical protein